MSHPVPSGTATVVVVSETRSVGVAILLTVLFGPLGMLYSTVAGALVMIAVSIVLAFFTLGFSILLTWPISILWGALAASTHNQRVIRGVR
ncbi:MAG TPA: hypothetical protein VF142_15140 [Longimicrobium sp.]